MKSWIWKGLLALVGCFAAAYVGDELLGGGAMGWTLGGTILAACCYPLFKSLMERNRGIKP